MELIKKISQTVARIWWSILPVLLLFTFAIPFAVINITLSDYSNSVPVNPKKTLIYSLKYNEKTKGKFAIGYGKVDEKKYVYYVVKKEGFKSVKRLPAKDVKIKEGKVKRPYLITYDMQSKSRLSRVLLGKYTGQKTYEFYLPENTITTNYKIDLE